MKQMNFADEWDAIAWMCRNQLGRRNLTDEQRTYLIGKQYEAQKMTSGGDRKSSAQSGHLIGGKTKDIIARKHGIGSTSVQRAEQFSKGLDAAESAFPGIKEAILSGEVKAPKSVIARIRDIPEDQRPGGCNQSNAYDRNETDKNRRKPHTEGGDNPSRKPKTKRLLRPCWQIQLFGQRQRLAKSVRRKYMPDCERLSSRPDTTKPAGNCWSATQRHYKAIWRGLLKSWARYARTQTRPRKYA